MSVGSCVSPVGGVHEDAEAAIVLRNRALLRGMRARRREGAASMQRVSCTKDDDSRSSLTLTFTDPLTLQKMIPR